MSRAKPTANSLAQGEIRSTEGPPVINPHAAGAGIGAQQIDVCIPGAEQTQIVRTFGAYTVDLHALADWLAANGIQTIAMESTGVYWIPLFEVLEEHGIHSCLISGNIARRLPARHKTDALDCQWIQTLHALGLLTESFRPDADLIALRALLDGLSLDLAQKIFSEIGTAVSKFPSEKHFTSWLKLCPNNQITGGKIILASGDRVQTPIVRLASSG